MPVSFYSQSLDFSLDNPSIIEQWILSTFNRESSFQSISLNIIFCTDEELLQINRDFLEHDYYTDIITFPISITEKVLEAELYISIDRVRENATNGDVSFLNELHRVIIHGALHLCGYGDKTSKEEVLMRTKEDEHLSYLK
ncbi:MAG: rRNA maturation RNase YbeY [Chitinophagales bacterium]